MGNKVVITRDATTGAFAPDLTAYFVQMVARTEYFPAGSILKSTTSSTASDVDASNLTVTFTAPANGIVQVFLEAYCRVANVAATQVWLLRDSSGNIAGTGRAAIQTASRSRIRLSIRVSGLTPGASYTWKWGYFSTDNTNAAEIILGVTNNSPAVIEVWSGI